MFAKGAPTFAGRLGGWRHQPQTVLSETMSGKSNRYRNVTHLHGLAAAIKIEVEAEKRLS
jgi:hypothetical protein